MKLKFILLYRLTSLSITEVKAQDPFYPILLVPETLNPAFAGTLITGCCLFTDLRK
jgi:hypothetical protein